LTKTKYLKISPSCLNKSLTSNMNSQIL